MTHLEAVGGGAFLAGSAGAEWGHYLAPGAGRRSSSFCRSVAPLAAFLPGCFPAVGVDGEESRDMWPFRLGRLNTHLYFTKAS